MIKDGAVSLLVVVVVTGGKTMANTNPRRAPLGERQPDQTLLKAMDAYHRARFLNPRDVPRALERVKKLCMEQGIDVDDLLYGISVIPRQDFERAEQAREWARLPPVPSSKAEPSLDKDGLEVTTSEDFYFENNWRKLRDEVAEAREERDRQ